MISSRDSFHTTVKIFLFKQCLLVIKLAHKKSSVCVHLTNLFQNRFHIWLISCAEMASAADTI